MYTIICSVRLKLKLEKSVKKHKRNFNAKPKPVSRIVIFRRKCRNIYFLENEKWEKRIVVKIFFVCLFFVHNVEVVLKTIYMRNKNVNNDEMNFFLSNNFTRLNSDLIFLVLRLIDAAESSR